jgi:hypothetical protein
VAAQLAASQGGLSSMSDIFGCLIVHSVRIHSYMEFCLAARTQDISAVSSG